MDEHVAILMDMCGPKIRVGKFTNGEIVLKQNARVTISCNNVVGDTGLIASQYKSLFKDVKKGERILLDDGNMELRVERIKYKEVFCKVVYGGVLKDNKGMNLPDSSISVSSFTAKDRNDVKLAMELGADFVALSFVRSEADIKALKRFMKKTGVEIPVIAKIEKPEAISNIDKILEVSYGIMIARGDLGIELPSEQVPLIQKDLIDRARHYRRPVIVATQMMESMITSSRPTRAEVGDVANAALSSADAVMLSAETAVGKYPVNAVKMMDRVLREIEAHQWETNSFSDVDIDADHSGQPSPRKAVAQAVSSLALSLKLQGIIIPTRSGTTAKFLVASRPTAPLFGVSSDSDVCRKLALHWGVVPLKIEEKITHDWKRLSMNISKRSRITGTGHTVLLVSGFDDNPDISEPVMKIINV
jgi:pyruvate kinase